MASEILAEAMQSAGQISPEVYFMNEIESRQEGMGGEEIRGAA